MRKSLENKRATLYMARNKITDDFYIGITCKKFNIRKSAHLSNARNNKISYFYNSIRKYGEEIFLWTKICVLPSYQEGLDMERNLIKELDPKYNLTKGGDGTLGYIHPPEVLKAISDNKKGRKNSEETRRRISASNKGRIVSIETRNKISEALVGRTHSDETKKKFKTRKPSCGMTGKKQSIESIKKRTETRIKNSGSYASEKLIEFLKSGRQGSKKTLCVSDGKIFNSSKEAEKHYGLKKGRICLFITGRIKSLPNGLVFKYLDKE